MTATLTTSHRPRFSGTARSRPRPHEAVGDRDGDRALPVRAGRLAEDRTERPAERPEAREADVEADLTHAAIGLAQEESRALDAAALQVAVRRLGERRAELPD